MLTTIPIRGSILELLLRVLFTGIPLGTFVLLARPHWRAIIQPLRGWDIPTMVVFWLIIFAVSVGAAYLVSGGSPGVLIENRAASGLAHGGPGKIALFYVRTFIQIFGEELFTVLPFLALLYWLFSKAKISRKWSIIIAWVLTALWFGSAHLPTYD